MHRSRFKTQNGPAVTGPLPTGASISSIAAPEISPAFFMTKCDPAGALAASYPFQTHPGAAEVAAVYADVNTQYTASQQAQAFTDQQQNELALIYPLAQKLATSICNTIVFNLENGDPHAHLDDAGRRNIAVLWGVVYIYDDGTPAPAPAPATPTPSAP